MGYIAFCFPTYVRTCEYRLSTIRTADKIVAIKDGKVEEVGDHDELMKRQGLYFSLVTAQMSDDDMEAEEREGEDTVAELEDGEEEHSERLFL